MGTTKKAKRRQLALVERTIQEVGWSMRICEALSGQLGCSSRTVYRLREELLQRIREEGSQHDRQRTADEWMLRLRGHQGLALAARRFGPLAAMMRMEAVALGIDEPLAEILPDSLESSSRVELLAELATDLTMEEVREIGRLMVET